MAIEGIYALAKPGDALAALNLNNEFNLFGKKTYFIASSFEACSVIDDALEEKEIVKEEVVEEKKSLLRNFAIGLLATVALAALACSAVVTGGATLVIAGAAIGAGVFTVAATVSDYKNGSTRSLLEFVGGLVMSSCIGALAGATIYGLWTSVGILATPEAVQLLAIFKSPLLINTVIPGLLKLGGMALLTGQGIFGLNQIVGLGTGQDFLLDKIFGGNRENYDSASMILMLLSMGYMNVASNIAAVMPRNGKEVFNYTEKANQHMNDSNRQVPVQTLQDVINNGTPMPDPQGSSATMYYSTITINGKNYNIEVLYDEVSNTIYHFEYARKAMGNLPAIPK